MAEARPKYLYGFDFMERLQDAGLIGKGIQRVVIDCKHDEYAVMYVQQAVDSRVLDALLAGVGIEVRVLGKDVAEKVISERELQPGEKLEGVSALGLDEAK